MPHPVRITLSPRPEENVIELNGKKVTDRVHLVDIHAEPGRVPRLILGVHLLPDHHEINGEMHVEVSEETQATLVALGWTPPQGDAAVTEGETDS